MVFFVIGKDNVYKAPKQSISKRKSNSKGKFIIIERVSYCIQFDIGTKTTKILKFIKNSQDGEQIIIDFSDSRELESTRIRVLRKEWALSNSPSRKHYGFSKDSNEKQFCAIIYQRLFLSPTWYPNFKKKSQQSSLFLHFFKDF